MQSLSPFRGCEAGEWGFCAWCVAVVDCHVSPVWWAAFVVLGPLVVCLAFGGGVCWPGLVGVSCFDWLSVAALGAARGTVSGCFSTPVVVWLVPLVWGPLQVLLGLLRGRSSSFPAGGPVAVPVGVVLSGLAVVFVPVVLCCPWLGAGVGSAVFAAPGWSLVLAFIGFDDPLPSFSGVPVVGLKGGSVTVFLEVGPHHPWQRAWQLLFLDMPDILDGGFCVLFRTVPVWSGLAMVLGGSSSILAEGLGCFLPSLLTRVCRWGQRLVLRRSWLRGLGAVPAGVCCWFWWLRDVLLCLCLCRGLVHVCGACVCGVSCVYVLSRVVCVCGVCVGVGLGVVWANRCASGACWCVCASVCFVSVEGSGCLSLPLLPGVRCWCWRFPRHSLHKGPGCSSPPFLARFCCWGY